MVIRSTRHGFTEGKSSHLGAAGLVLLTLPAVVTQHFFSPFYIIIQTLIVKVCVVVNEMAEEFQHSEIHSGNPYGKQFKGYMCTVECYS